MGKYRLELQTIERSLRDVQEAFPTINNVLQSRRESMTDAVVGNMMAGYTFIDKAISDGTDLLTPKQVSGLLELNHIVLCGMEPNIRQEYQPHIAATTQRFYRQKAFNIDDVLRWYHKHRGKSAWKLAAGLYVRILSQPQLYIEGNHRTGALIMSYILARNGKPPFVLSINNAKAYFDPSTLVKNTKKTATSLLTKLPRIRKLFADFLKNQADERYVYVVD